MLCDFIGGFANNLSTEECRAGIDLEFAVEITEIQ